MLMDEASEAFSYPACRSKMSQLSALWNAAGGLTLNAQGFEALDVAVPEVDTGLRGVTIWRDTLRVPDAGDAAV